MSSRYPRVRAGEPLTQISADAWNAAMDAAEAHALTNRRPPTPPAARRGDDGTVLVRNDSGVDVPRFGVLGIGGILFPPKTTTGPSDEQLVLSGKLPFSNFTHDKFMVTVEPIKPGGIGRAKIDGVTQVQIEKTLHNEITAGFFHNDVTKLRGGGSGAQVLYQESGLGLRWAVVRLQPTLNQFRMLTVDSQDINGITCVETELVNGAEKPIYVHTYHAAWARNAGDIIYVYQLSAADLSKGLEGGKYRMIPDPPRHQVGQYHAAQIGEGGLVLFDHVRATL